MCLFLVNLSCLVALCSNIFGGKFRNSRFCELGQRKFPIRAATGICSKRLNWRDDFFAEGRIGEISRFYGKSREFASTSPNPAHRGGRPNPPVRVSAADSGA